MEQFTLLLIYSLGFRWFIFQYKKTACIRDKLLTIKLPIVSKLIEELFECCYCQMIEASTIIYLIFFLQGSLDISLIEALFAILANGWFLVVTEAVFEYSISCLEDLQNFNFKE